MVNHLIKSHSRYLHGAKVSCSVFFAAKKGWSAFQVVLRNPPSALKPSVCLGHRTLKNYNSCQRRKRLPGVPRFLHPRGGTLSKKHYRTLFQVPGGTKQRFKPWLKRDKKELMCAFFNMFFTLSSRHYLSCFPNPIFTGVRLECQWAESVAKTDKWVIMEDVGKEEVPKTNLPPPLPVVSRCKTAWQESKTQKGVLFKTRVNKSPDTAKHFLPSKHLTLPVVPVIFTPL